MKTAQQFYYLQFHLIMELNNAAKQHRKLSSAAQQQTQQDVFPESQSKRLTRYNMQKIDSYTKFDIKGIIRLQFLEQKKKKLIKSYNQGISHTSRDSLQRQKKSSKLDMIIPSFQAFNINSSFLPGFNEFIGPNKSKQKDYDINESFNRPRSQSKNLRQLRRGTSVQDSLNLNIHVQNRQIQDIKVNLPKTQTKVYWQRKQEVSKDFYADIHKKEQNSTERRVRSKNIQNILRRRCSTNFTQMMDEYRRRMKLPAQTKIFIFKSPDTWLKQALLQKNWVQNPDSTSKLYNLKWTSKLCLQKQNNNQMINHFYQSDLLTSKEGLAKVVKKSSVLSMICPRSFDLGTEMKQFVQDFRKTQILGFLKKIIVEIRKNQILSTQLQKQIVSSSSLKQQFRKMRQASNFTDQKAQHRIYLHIPYTVQLCAFCQNIRCQIDDEMRDPSNKLDEKTLKNLYNFSHLLPPYTQYHQPQHPHPHQQPYLHFNPQNINLHTPSPSLNLASFSLLRLLYSYHVYFQNKLNTYRVEGDKNIWIVKNRNSSKGIGIYLGYQLHQLIKKTQNKLVQKYVEQCGLYQRRKYDVRVWVLVLCFQPLIAYFYDQFYCRLCSEPYSFTTLQFPQSHLTNYTQNRHTFGQNQDSILSYPKFITLASQALGLSIDETKQKVNKKINNLVYHTLIPYKDIINSQPQCFQLFGFDVLVTNNFDFILLQVNLSPACDAERDDWLQGKVKSMANGLIQIVTEKVDRSRARQLGWRSIEVDER